MKTNSLSQLQQEETKETKAPRQSCRFVISVAFCAILLSSLGAGSAAAATRYVWQGSPSPAPPYDNWANAATNIQDAVDAAAPGDTVLVTNGVYATGGRAVRTLAPALVTRVADSGRVFPITDQQNAGRPSTW